MLKGGGLFCGVSCDGVCPRALCVFRVSASLSVTSRKACAGSRSSAANAEIVEVSKAINTSLSTLGLVISRLAEVRKPGKGRGSEVHVPYRSSKLTRVLQDCLGGNAQTAIVINCSVSTQQVAETISTLRFGTRARSCANMVSVNDVGEEHL